MWQTRVVMLICHKGKAGIAGHGLVTVNYGGKLGVDTLFATWKWNLCGKLRCQWRVCHTGKAGTAGR